MRTLREPTCEVAVVGAGPYGLATAAHLRASGVDTRVFGRVMEFWERQMPRGMLLRSKWHASHISDPDDRLTLDRYRATCPTGVPEPIPLETFVDYGRWFQRAALPDLDGRTVTRIEPASESFRLVLEDGERLRATRVVVAVGLGRFVRRPPVLDRLPPALVSHSSDHAALEGFAGRRVIVVGGGQSAVETTALLAERGASVELIVRAPSLRWLVPGRLARQPEPIRKIFYTRADVGPPGVNRLIAAPELLRHLPPRTRRWATRIAMRPAAAVWLRSRVDGATITTGRRIVAADAHAGRVALSLDDGSTRRVDHVIAATGYRVDLDRMDLLAPELARAVRCSSGAPLLNGGLESSVPGLHFVGAAAAASYGPLMFFVAGTGHAAASVSRALSGDSRRAAS